MTPIRLVSPPPWIEPPAPPAPGSAPAIVGRHRIYQPGDAWYATREDPGGPWFMFADGPGHSRIPLRIAPEHVRGGAIPIVVVLPGTPSGVPFCLHGCTSAGPVGWVVEGDLEHLDRLTVSPSINYRGVWHGFVRRGRLETA